MAADANRLAAALAYEDERRRRLAETIPTLIGPTTQPRRSVRTDLENLSAGLGQGITTQLKGIKGLITDPVGTAKGAYEAARAVVRDPSVLAAALSQMGQKTMSGPLGAGEVIGEMIGPRKTGPVMAELDVYHGTPHRFPATEANPLGEFDASKIGTGEGAQAFGHGIYLAEKPTVAQDYQFMLSKIDPETVTYQGKPAEKWYEMAQAEQDRAHRLRDQKAIDRANAKLAYWENVMTRRHPEDVKRVANDPDDGWPTFANYANSLDMSKFGGIGEAGSLYKADLPDEMIDRMLDWDKPLSEQSANVKKAIQSLKKQLTPQDLENLGGDVNLLFGNDVSAAEFLNTWEALRGKTGVGENLLRETGIPGIKYLDAGSRGQSGSGTRNFVVFPGEEKKVRILERDGQKAPPQKIAQALEATKPVRVQAKAGGEVAESNGYFYKGGQFLPSTEAEPGKWKIGKKIVTTKQEVIAPGEMAVQPTPFSRSIYQAALGQGDWVTKTPEGLKVRENIKTSTGEPVTPDMKIRLGVKGVLGKEELTLQEFVDAYNKGQRWFDVQPDAPVVRSK